MSTFINDTEVEKETIERRQGDDQNFWLLDAVHETATMFTNSYEEGEAVVVRIGNEVGVGKVQRVLHVNSDIYYTVTGETLYKQEPDDPFDYEIRKGLEAAFGDGQTELPDYTRLPESEVAEIKWLLQNTDIRQTKISEYYGVNNPTVSRIKHERTYEDVEAVKPIYL